MIRWKNIPTFPFSKFSRCLRGIGFNKPVCERIFQPKKLSYRPRTPNNDVPLIGHLSCRTLLRSLLNGKSSSSSDHSPENSSYVEQCNSEREQSLRISCSKTRERDFGLKIDTRWVQAPLMDVSRKLTSIESNLRHSRVLSPRLPIQTSIKCMKVTQIEDGKRAASIYIGLPAAYSSNSEVRHF